jgi:hypothetical protein
MMAAADAASTTQPSALPVLSLLLGLTPDVHVHRHPRQHIPPSPHPNPLERMTNPDLIKERKSP